MVTSTAKLLNTVKRRQRLKSDYQIVQLLGTSTSLMSQWRRGKVMGEDLALRAAELAGMDPAYVLASLNAERTKSAAARRVWRDLAQLAAEAAKSDD